MGTRANLLTGDNGRGVVLGVSADYHDAAAAVLVDGRVVAAAEEERFSRKKHDPALPLNAVAWCLEQAGVVPGDLDAVAFYDKPFTKYERILTTHALVGPRGLRTLVEALRVWSSRKLWVAYRIERMLSDLGFGRVPLHFAEHHQSHAASAFYPSPFENATVVTLDGVGEWATSSIAHGTRSGIRMLREQRFPDSTGLLYSTLTAHCGFAVNDGEYKLMGLAPFGQPRYVERLRDHVVRIHDDGSVSLDQRYFDYRAGRRMGSRRLDQLLDGPPLQIGGEVGSREADIARSAQVLVEEVVLSAATYAQTLTGEPNLCLAGGVALNCVANGQLLRSGRFDDIWIQPAAGDAGGAVGAAYVTWHDQWGRQRRGPGLADAMGGAALGPSYRSGEICRWLEKAGVEFVALDDDELAETVASALSGASLVGWFRGRMEFGPRALGHRSILADPRDAAMVSRINRQVKEREGFRPFAPAVLAECADEWFDLDRPSPYMLMTVPVRGFEVPEAGAAAADQPGFGERLGAVRSPIPACTHVDGTARVQTVDRDRAPDFHRLLTAFHHQTGCPVLLNTSFNGRDEPIVRTPADALRSAISIGLDLLVLENCVIDGPTLRSERAQ